MTTDSTGSLDWRLIAGGFILAAVLSGLSMLYLDEAAARYFRETFDADTRRFFGHWVGALGKPEFYFSAAALIAAACWIARQRMSESSERLRRAMHGALFVIFSIASAGILVNLLKFIIGRMRPRELLDNGLYGFTPFNTDFGMNSFPSGHSQMVWSLAVSLVLIFPRLWPYLFAFATAIAASRFLASVHFVSDTIMGAYIGGVIPLLLKHYVYDRRGIPLRP